MENIENIEPNKEVSREKKDIADSKSESLDEEFGWTDKEIREVLEASPFYKDLNGEAVNDLIKRIQGYVTKKQIEH